MSAEVRAKAASRLAGSDTSATTTSTAQSGFAAATLAAVSAVASRETSTRVRPETPSRARRRLRAAADALRGGRRRRKDETTRGRAEAIERGVPARRARAENGGFGGEGTGERRERGTRTEPAPVTSADFPLTSIARGVPRLVL